MHPWMSLIGSREIRVARPNLLRIDDVLLRAGAWLTAIWLVASVVALGLAASAEAGLAVPIAASALGGTAPLALLTAGFRLRRRERRAWALHRLVEDHVELCASDLLRSSDFTAASLDRAIRDLGNAGAGFLVWDRAADVVQDGRLRGKRVQIDECGACGAKVSLTLRVGRVSAARCPYCHDPLPSDVLWEEKADLIDRLESPDAPATPLGTSFSVTAFALLMVFCWPLALVYAFYHWRIQADG